MQPDPEIVMEAVNLACHFDVSPPFLTRVLDRQPRRILKAVDGVSFRVRRGQTFSIVGESGCGKSTLAKLIVGLNRPTSGDIAINAIEHGDGVFRQPRIQMIFQDPYASLNPRWSVGAVVGEPIRQLKLVDGEVAISRRIHELLEIVGLSSADAKRFPHEFSGGQRQRISIARALATEADLLVCDEPTSALDVSVQAQVLNLLSDLQKELGLTYIFISHNLSVVRHLSHEIAVMYLGRFVEKGSADQVFSCPEHPYTQLLLDTVPDIANPNRDRRPATGELPNAIRPPSGCTFHPRCKEASDICRGEIPAPARWSEGIEGTCHHRLAV